MNWLQLTIAGLATYRATVLISADSGPFKLMSKLRSFLSRKARTEPIVRKSDVHKGIKCPRCSSVWNAIPIAAYAIWYKDLPEWMVWSGDWLLLMLALSGIAVLLNKIPDKK